MEVLTSFATGVMTIILNRPEKRNAMDGQLVTALRQALHEAITNDACRVLLIRGEGDHFCAGADIAWMQTIAQGSYEHNVNDAQNLADLLYELYICPKPTIVLAHGITLGGGLGLLAACDIAIAENNATFGFSEVKLGLIPAIISPYVIRAIGERAAQYHFLLGERFDTNQAKNIGLIHQCIDLKNLLNSGEQLASQLQQNGPLAMSAAKKLIHHMSKLKLTDDLSQDTAEILAHLRSSSEAQEGLKAFLEKRAPIWSK